DGQLEMVSMIGTAVLTASLFVPVLYLTESATALRPDLGEMEAIEASIAYKKAPQKQPQKKIEAPQPDKHEGVSHDALKPVNACRSDADCKHAGETCDLKTNRCVSHETKPPKKEDTDPLAKYKHPIDDDTQTGKPTTEAGDYNDSEFGWA